MNDHFDEFLKSVAKTDHPAIKVVVDALASIVNGGLDGDAPKQTQAQWKASSTEYSNSAKSQSLMPATALEALLSNFASEVEYLHSDITTLRSQLQPHLHASEFDQSLACDSGTPSSYVERGADMSPTQTKIAEILNEVVRARTRIEHLRSVLVN